MRTWKFHHIQCMYMVYLWSHPTGSIFRSAGTSIPFIPVDHYRAPFWAIVSFQMSPLFVSQNVSLRCWPFQLTPKTTSPPRKVYAKPVLCADASTVNPAHHLAIRYPAAETSHKQKRISLLGRSTGSLESLAFFDVPNPKVRYGNSHPAFLSSVERDP